MIILLRSNQKNIINSVLNVNEIDSPRGVMECTLKALPYVKLSVPNPSLPCMSCMGYPEVIVVALG
jgi:hypothetical protein